MPETTMAMILCLLDTTRQGKVARSKKISGLEGFAKYLKNPSIAGMGVANNGACLGFALKCRHSYNDFDSGAAAQAGSYLVVRSVSPQGSGNFVPGRNVVDNGLNRLAT